MECERCPHQEQIQKMLQELMVILAEKRDVETSFSHLQNRAFELYNKLNEMSDLENH